MIKRNKKGSATCVAEPFLLLCLDDGLKRCVLRRAGEGDNVADVLHTRDEQDETLEAKAKAGVRAASPTTRVYVPP